jgi:hypothetical protein
MKKIVVVLILCILAVAIGYVLHQTHSSTEFQLGESGIANNIAFVVLNYEFSESYISRYGGIEYPEEGAYKGTTIHYDYAHPKGRKMYPERRKIYPYVSEEGWIAYQMPKNFYISEAKVRVDFPPKAGEIFGEKTLTWSFGS